MKTTTPPAQPTASQHTPTPWILHCAEIKAFTNPDKIICDPFAGFQEAHRLEARQLLPIDEREANAAYIVRAVNSHAALVDILERLLQFAENAVPEIHADNMKHYGEQARAALAAAKNGGAL